MARPRKMMVRLKQQANKASSIEKLRNAREDKKLSARFLFVTIFGFSFILTGSYMYYESLKVNDDSIVSKKQKNNRAIARKEGELLLLQREAQLNQNEQKSDSM